MTELKDRVDMVYKLDIPRLLQVAFLKLSHPKLLTFNNVRMVYSCKYLTFLVVRFDI